MFNVYVQPYGYDTSSNLSPLLSSNALVKQPLSINHFCAVTPPVLLTGIQPLVYLPSYF